MFSNNLRMKQTGAYLGRQFESFIAYSRSECVTIFYPKFNKEALLNMTRLPSQNRNSILNTPGAEIQCGLRKVGQCRDVYPFLMSFKINCIVGMAISH